MHPYERWIARRYLANAFKSKFRESTDRPDEHFHEWIRAHRQSLGLPPFNGKDEICAGEDYVKWTRAAGPLEPVS